MATIDELIASIEVEHEAALKRRDKATAEAKAILSLAAQEGRANLTAEEDERLAQLAVARDGAKADATARETIPMMRAFGIYPGPLMDALGMI